MAGAKGRPRKRTTARPRWSDRALRDLEAIDDYIAQDSPTAATRWVQRLIATAEAAAEAPLAGRMLPERREPNLREVLLKHYRVVYRVRRSAVEILTIFEGHKLFAEDAIAPEDEG